MVVQLHCPKCGRKFDARMGVEKCAGCGETREEPIKGTLLTNNNRTKAEVVVISEKRVKRLFQGFVVIL